MSDAALPSQEEPAPGQTLFFEFHGKAAEYFRIWIVNLLLSIVTLGVYSAWAKVRNKRYFYGNTRLDGAAFEYHAKPMQILKGRLIVVLLLVLYVGAVNVSPYAGFALYVALFFLMPWMVNQSLRFNARMSSYRNVHFGFAGSYGQAVWVFAVLPFLCSLPLGLLLPIAHRRMSLYVSKGMSYGGRKFDSHIPGGDFFPPFFEVIALGVLFSAFVGVFGSLLTVSHIAPDLSESVIALIPFLIWAFLLFLVPYYRAKARNIVFKHLELESGHRFASRLAPWRMGWITFSNLVCIALSLGLLVPWARLRWTRYVALRTAVKPAGDLGDFVAALESSQPALGSEMSDLMGWDVGF